MVSSSAGERSTVKSSIDPIELTRSLVAIPSENPFRTIENEGRLFGIGAETRVQEFLESILESLGFRTSRQYVVTEEESNRDLPPRWNLLAERGDAEKSILFFGHSDTVDVKQGWKSDPFIARQQGSGADARLYGLGANDMKSGIAAFLAAFSKAESAQYRTKVAVLVDEEYWSFGAERLLRSAFLDDVVFAVVPEIGERVVEPGVQQIGLGRLGRQEYHFKLKGRACHGADAFHDPSSINAVHESVRLQHRLLEYCESKRRVFEHSGIKALNSAYLNFQSGGLGALSVPDTAEFILDRSLVPGEDPERELEELRKLVSNLKKSGALKAEVEIQNRQRPTAACAPYFIGPQSEWIQQLAAATAATGGKPEYFIGRSVADENRIAAGGIPTAILSPSGAGSHTSDEWVSIPSVQRVTDVVVEFLNRL